MERYRLLSRADVDPSQRDLEVAGIFNPGAVEIDAETVYLLVRVAERPADTDLEHDHEWLAFPRRAAGPEYRIETVREPAAAYTQVDGRAYRTKREGWLRLTTISHLRLVKMSRQRNGRLKVDEVSSKPTLFPLEEWEEYGVEDARITPIKGEYYITYVAVSRHGAATALARTVDFEQFERLGVIFPVENKDVVLFPTEQGRKGWALHRPLAVYPFGPIEMWFAESPDLVHWGNNRPLVWKRAIRNRETTLADGQKVLRIGAGTPPVRFEEGWLEIYHAAVQIAEEDHIGRYCGLAMVLDADKPYEVRREPRHVLLKPTEEFEREGFVSEVVFPTGIVQSGDAFTLFYGAADEQVGMAVVSRREIEESMEPPERRRPADRPTLNPSGPVHEPLS